MAWRPENQADLNLMSKLSQIPPSRDRYGNLWPCRAVMKTGELIDRVLMVNEAHRLPGEINVRDIADISEHPQRLPAKFATQLYAAGESGMGYILYTIALRSGATIVVVSGDLCVDFPDLPLDIQASDIVNVLPHEGRERTITGDFVRSAPFKTCCFVPPEECRGMGRQSPD